MAEASKPPPKPQPPAQGQPAVPPAYVRAAIREKGGVASSRPPLMAPPRPAPAAPRPGAGPGRP
ncbi:MAG: hypothetical protein QXO51_08340, partial [Halobacteria archaeon]